MTTGSVVITSATRTPIGNFQGSLQSLSATDLGAAAIKAAINSAQIDTEIIDSVIMGCVLPAGLGQAPARQASRGAGVPDSVGCSTLNKVCGSGMKALMFGHDSILAGSAEVIVAGGMESMSNAPYLLPKARSGYRIGHQRALDHIFLMV
jgi:acetyl-CoA C-acetyltransferase